MEIFHALLYRILCASRKGDDTWRTENDLKIRMQKYYK